MLNLKKEGGGGVAAAPFSVRNMLSHYAYNVIYPHYRDFAHSVQGLDLKIDNYCDNLDRGQENTDKKQQAKHAFVEAMLTFHRLQAFQIGTILENHKSQEIYSPIGTYSYCSIDHQVVKRELGNQYELRGLGVLEYLLFDEEVAYKCHVSIESLDNWQKKEQFEREADRCHYMQLISDNLKIISSELKDAWAANQDNWGRYLVRGTSSRKSTAIIFDSLFYLETEVKDKKILSLIRHAQGQEVDREHIYSDLYLLSIAANLEGFVSIFTGQGKERSLGLADLLTAMGHAPLVKTIIDTSVNLIEKLKEKARESNLMEKTQSEEDFYSSIYAEVKLITDILKIQLPSILNLDPPAQVKGDSD